MSIAQQQFSPIYGVPIVGCDDRFEDRAAVGRRLAEQLQQYRGSRAIVLALPPGGVAVAGEVARALRLPLDALIARGFAVRPYPGVMAGALSEAGGLCFNAAVLRLPGVSVDTIWHEASQAQHEIITMVAAYRHGRPLPALSRRPVILVDDGLHSGLIQLAALRALRRLHPQRCIVATPKGTIDALQVVARHADAVVTLEHLTDAEELRGPGWRLGLGDEDSAILLDRYQRQTAL
jgi:putative phosphoribosyl transferase